MKVKFKKLDPMAVMPTKAHPTDAGFDLTTISDGEPCDMGAHVYHTGIAVEIPKGYVGLVFPRSSISNKNISLTNSVGVIDSGYRGEIMAKFKPDYTWGSTGDYGEVYKAGDRIAQLIIMPYPEVEFEEVNELSESDRGKGGFGSTGK